MARKKKFSGGKKISDFEPLEFDFNDETFKCNPAIQGSVLLEFIREAGNDESGAGSAAALYNFLQEAMPEEEYERFDKLLHNKDLIINIEDIGEVVAWLIEEYSDRPTERPED